MKWIEAKVIFEGEDKCQAAELIAQVFDDMGIKGVVIEDPDQEPDEGWGDNAVERPGQDAVIGFWADNRFSEEKHLRLENALDGLRRHARITTRLSFRQIDEQDWAESWKAYFWPEKISDRITVKPTWRPYQPTPGEVVLEIDPGMAFGTGTHATTALCIRLIEAHLRPGCTFLDIGTGSGILMIAAAKLGAAKLFGVDIDEVAVEIAEKNLRLNQVDSDCFALATGNLVDVVPQKFELVAANILSEVIVRLLDDIGRVLKRGGTLICSGIIAENRETVLLKMAETGFEVLEVSQQEEWVAIVAKFK